MNSPSFKKIYSRFHNDQSGITGLETAIVLIAFVVVAAVFAFTVLTTGLFTSEKAKETALAGVATTSSSLTIKGSIVARSDQAQAGTATDNIDYLRVKVAAATGVERILFDPEDIIITYVDQANVVQLQAPGVVAANGTDADRTIAAAPINDQNADIATCAGLIDVWCYTNDGNGDLLLDPGEVHELYIFLDDLPTRLPANRQFTVEIIPQDGAVLKFERRTPLSLSAVMNLD